jgi:predicted RNA-binding protein YlxR (DUF448 family)
VAAAWVAGGAQALGSKGPSGPDPKLPDEQLARLKARLDQGLVAAVSVAGGKRLAAHRSAWICFADECGQTLTARKATTWAPKGRTPVVKVTDRQRHRAGIGGRRRAAARQPRRAHRNRPGRRGEEGCLTDTDQTSTTKAPRSGVRKKRPAAR